MRGAAAESIEYCNREIQSGDKSQNLEQKFINTNLPYINIYVWLVIDAESTGGVECPIYGT